MEFTNKSKYETIEYFYDQKFEKRLPKDANSVVSSYNDVSDASQNECKILVVN